VEADPSLFKDVFGGVPSVSGFLVNATTCRVDVEGGGDLSRGGMGQWDELSPDLVARLVLDVSNTPSTLPILLCALFADSAL
jgi:hypothetical protein